jgi:hypothetical protein
VGKLFGLGYTDKDVIETLEIMKGNQTRLNISDDGKVTFVKLSESEITDATLVEREKIRQRLLEKAQVNQ